MEFYKWYHGYPYPNTIKEDPAKVLFYTFVFILVVFGIISMVPAIILYIIFVLTGILMNTFVFCVCILFIPIVLSGILMVWLY